MHYFRIWQGKNEAFVSHFLYKRQLKLVKQPVREKVLVTGLQLTIKSLAREEIRFLVHTQSTFPLLSAYLS